MPGLRSVPIVVVGVLWPANAPGRQRSERRRPGTITTFGERSRVATSGAGTRQTSDPTWLWPRRMRSLTRTCPSPPATEPMATDVRLVGYHVQARPRSPLASRPPSFWIAADAGDPQRLYAALRPPSNVGARIAVSADGGRTWKRFGPARGRLPPAGPPHPPRPGRVALAKTTLYVSRNGGRSFSSQPLGFFPKLYRDVGFVGSSSATRSSSRAPGGRSASSASRRRSRRTAVCWPAATSAAPGRGIRPA